MPAVLYKAQQGLFDQSLIQWLPALYQRLSAPYQWLSAPYQRLSAPLSTAVGTFINGCRHLYQWLSAPCQRLSAPYQWLSGALIFGGFLPGIV